MRAVLALADGSLFAGQSIGAPGASSGEVVFNTAMTGYQEILTDPSYARQLITLTYPHIGNTGVTEEDCEARRAFCAGLIIGALPVRSSSWRSQGDLQSFLQAQGLVGIAGIDTRRLTRLIRTRGAQAGAVLAGEAPDPDAALALARRTPGLEGADLVREVTTDEPYQWCEGSWQPERGNPAPTPGAVGSTAPHVIACDFGVKRNILRILVDLGCRVTVVPATTPAPELLAMAPDGVFLANGPGDPSACDYAIETVRELLAAGVPLFGICLGCQLLALAAGGRTLKMKFGHHGANHPVLALADGRVLITSQNHGFAVDGDSLPPDWEITHRSLFDDSLQGIAHKTQPAFGFQGHPEASPGPHDVLPLFEGFLAAMKRGS